MASNHVIFNFDRSMVCGEGDLQFLERLCLHYGFQCSPGILPMYLSGEKSTLLDHFPELGALRDIVFTFKLLLSPTADGLPEVARWSADESTLYWSRDEKNKQQYEFQVDGFNTRLRPVPPPDAKEQQGSMLGWFPGFSSEVKPRAPLSSADPSIVANSKILSEDDVLYLDVSNATSTFCHPSFTSLTHSLVVRPFVRSLARSGAPKIRRPHRKT